MRTLVIQVWYGSKICNILTITNLRSLTFWSTRFILILARDPKNDVGLMKLKWPPIGYQNNERISPATTKDLSEDRKRQLYQRRSYRKQISTPICLTYEKLNLMKSPTNALVSGNCDGAILNGCMYHQPNIILIWYLYTNQTILIYCRLWTNSRAWRN